MSKSTTWTPQEDKALLELYQQRRIHKWSKISLLLFEEHQIKKTPKKCRERFKNHLNPLINKDVWSQDEVDRLLQKQSQLGNRWAEIANHLQGRTDNAVKNKYYSLFRRALNNINSQSTTNKAYKYKEIKMSFVYKLTSLIDNKFKEAQEVPQDLLSQAEELKTAILQFGVVPQGMEIVPTAEQLSQLMAKVQYINLQFKKKVVRKQNRRISTNKYNLTKTSQTITDPPRLEVQTVKEEAIIFQQVQQVKKEASPRLEPAPSLEKIQIKNFNIGEENIWVQGWHSEDSDLWRIHKNNIYDHNEDSF